MILKKRSRYGGTIYFRVFWGMLTVGCPGGIAPWCPNTPSKIIKEFELRQEDAFSIGDAIEIYSHSRFFSSSLWWKYGAYPPWWGLLRNYFHALAWCIWWSFSLPWSFFVGSWTWAKTVIADDLAQKILLMMLLLLQHLKTNPFFFGIPVFSETGVVSHSPTFNIFKRKCFSPLSGSRKDVVQRRSEVSGAQFFTSLFGNHLLGPWIYWDGHWRNGNQEGVMARWQSCKWQVTCRCWLSVRS